MRDSFITPVAFLPPKRETKIQTPVAENLSLFDEPIEIPITPLGSKLAQLASQNIFIGASSWKYEGWIGSVYNADRYLSRGRFSQKRFESECLAEYAATFPIVCGDFSFYQFPSPAYWERLFSSAPATLKYAFKAPEDITVRIFPTHPRYGPRGGEPNASFLDAALFQGMFLDLLRPYRDRIAVLIFEFGTFGKQTYPDVAAFLADLDPFLRALPGDFRYAIEVRNPEFLSAEYFACLRSHRVGHVFNAWSRMPEITVQMRLPDVFTADFTTVRALLRRGRPYEEAVAKFAPYKAIQEPNLEVRQAVKDLISKAREKNQPSYIFVNNRLEGNAPQTIDAIVSD